MGHIEVLFFLCALNIAGRYLRKQYPFTLIIRGLISCFSFWNTYLKLSSCVVMFLILSGYSLSLTSFTHTLFFFALVLFLLFVRVHFKENIWRTLRGRPQTVWRDFPKYWQIKKDFHESPLFQTSVLWSTDVWNCLTVKRDSYWVFWT